MIATIIATTTTQDFRLPLQSCQSKFYGKFAKILDNRRRRRKPQRNQRKGTATQHNTQQLLLQNIETEPKKAATAGIKSVDV